MTPSGATRIRSLVLHAIDPSVIAAAERWYWRTHGPEIAGRYGMWAARLQSHLPVAAPDYAQTLGYMNWRVTEALWHALPDPGPDGALSFTPPPAWGAVAPCLTFWYPEDDFCGADAIPDARPALRFVMLHRYRPGCDEAAADHWFMTRFAPALAADPRVWRFFSYRARPDRALPGRWNAAGAPPPGSVRHGWVRCSELWLDGFADWQGVFQHSPPSCPPPPWAGHSGRFPYFIPDEEIVSSFILDRPTDDFLRGPAGGA